MSKHSKQAQQVLLIVAAIIVVLNLIASRPGFRSLRLDLTEKNIFSLSQGTKNIVEGLNPDKPITIRLYVTRDNKMMPQWAQSYSQTVLDLLLEIERISGGKVMLEKIDPRPDTDDEDRAVADDIQGYNSGDMGDKAYFGLAIECLQQKEVIPTLNPNDEANLEYQIARAIAKVSNTKRQVVGVMCPMPIAAPAFNFPGMPQRQPPWVAIQQLTQDYDVRPVDMSSDKIDKDVSVLLVVHPYGISETAEFAIDQFVLRGGKVIAFVDPQCLVAKGYDQQGQPGMSPTVSTSPMSDMPKLFAAWGIKYDQSRIVADMTYRTRIGPNRAVPTFLTVPKDALNQDNPVTSNLELVQLFGAGGFSLEEKEGISYAKLIESSETSEYVDSTAAEEAQREGTLKTFNSDGRKKTLVVRLSGKFKSAFPEGAPKAKDPMEGAPRAPGVPGLPPGFPGIPGAPGGEGGGEDAKDAGAPAGEKKEEAPPVLKEGDGQGVVFVFSDADMMYDAFALETDQNGRPMPIARNSNIPLLLNVVDMLGGSSDLIHVRSRGLTKRPFTTMSKLQADVEEEFRPKLEKLRADQQKVVEDIAKKGGAKKSIGGIVILEGDKEEMKKLREQQLDLNRQEREVRKQQNRRKDIQEMVITWTNILAVPLLLAAFGIALALYRSSQRAAH